MSEIPAIEMSRIGKESLRREGIVVTTVEDSLLDDPRRLQPHYHDFFQVTLLEGEGAVMHDFRDYRVCGPTLLFLTPGQVHTIRKEIGADGVVVSFSQSFYDHNSPPPSALLDLPFFFPDEAAPLLPVPTGDEFRIGEVMEEILAEFTRADAFSAESLRAWLRIFFARAARLYALKHPVGNMSAAALLVRRFRLEVERRFREDLTLKDYAHELGVSANHLNDVVHAEARQSAGAIVRQRRVLDAKRLLSHSGMSVSEIGYSLGFHDMSYFSRFFRRETGLAPGDFRRQIREKYQSKED